MKNFFRPLLLALIVLGVSIIAEDSAFQAQASSSPSSSSYNRKTYRPTSQRRLRSIGYVGDYSDVACHTWLTPDDVYYLNPTELRILRNTIYARHGRKFKDAKLRNYFYQFSWYRPYRNEVPMSELSKTEQHNISLIQAFE